MRWAAKQRMGFIKGAVERGEPINRIDLVKEFGVSTQTASADISNYRALHPGTMIYDKSLKTFMPVTDNWRRGSDV